MKRGWIESCLRLLLVTFLVTLALSACGGGGGGGSDDSVSSQPTSSSSGSGDQEDFFPYYVGNRWVYRYTVSQSGGEPSVSTNITRIDGTRIVSGAKVAVLKEEIFGASGRTSIEEYYLKDANGLYYYGNNDPSDAVTPLIAPYQVAKFPLTANESFTQMKNKRVDYGRDIDGDGTNETLVINSTVTVVGFEKVVTEAGVFEGCVKLETSIHETVMLSRGGALVSATGTENQWYAPGIGCVRTSSTMQNGSTTMTRDHSLLAYYVNGHRSENLAPVVVSARPAGSVAGSVAAVSATFSEEMDPATIDTLSFTVEDGANNKQQGTVSYADRIATFTASAALQPGTYTATISSTAADLAGNVMEEGYSWAFTVDATSPAIVSTEPAANATLVGLSSSVKVVFTEEMDPATINGSSFSIEGGGNRLSGSINYASKTATFTPSAALKAGTLYTVTISNTVTDTAGNPMSSSYAWSFTTTSGP